MHELIFSPESELLISKIGAWFAIIGLLLFTFAAPVVYFLKEKNATTGDSQPKFHFIIWPAKAAQAFFNALWGEVGKGLFGVLTGRSIMVTLIFSVAINLICIQLILVSAPPDAPEFGLDYIKILYTSEIWFIFCNFIGDLFSIHVTRFLLHKIIHKKASWKYIAWDFGGIIGGYFLMLLPSWLLFQFGLSFFESPNEIIHAGLFGNVLIPFFLGIFALSYFPSLITFFALFSVLSITVPTGIYLSLMIFVNIGYRTYKRFLVEKSRLVYSYAKVIKSVGAYLSMLSSALLALLILFGKML